jgi:hypothetical protein
MPGIEPGTYGLRIAGAFGPNCREAFTFRVAVEVADGKGAAIDFDRPSHVLPLAARKAFNRDGL